MDEVLAAQLLQLTHQLKKLGTRLDELNKTIKERFPVIGEDERPK